MNSFANSLFSLLFGWSRTIVQQVWTSSASGRFGAFFSWLGDHWIAVAVTLALVGTLTDILVWLLRWRPDLVWKTRLRRLARWLKRDRSAANRHFEKGYQGGVALDNLPDEPAREPEDPVWTPPDWAQGTGEESDIYTHSFTEALAPETLAASVAMERQGKARSADGDTEPPPLVTESWLSSAYQRMEPPAPERRRRSVRNEKKKPSWTNKIMLPEVEDDSLLDGLPPAVDRQQAFHEPVYPMQNHTGADTGWQPPDAGQSTEGNYRR